MPLDNSNTADHDRAVTAAKAQDDRDVAATRAVAQVDANILTGAGQRRINFMWEITQAVIAILTVGTTVAVAATMALRGELSALVLLGNNAGVVIGFYYGRTNHVRTGGVGPHDIGR